ncbi:MAG: metallophosphoesterase [Anaerolineales bacterium]|nr:metallophosphoesterase [Anaerolineales bacterium]
MAQPSMKALLISDVVVSFLYSQQVRTRFPDVDVLFACGDLGYYYIEYILNALDVPCFFVRGNHDKVVEYSLEAQRTLPHGAVDLHLQSLEFNGYLLAGIEGSLRYRPGSYQYTQRQMWSHVFRLVPRLFSNRMRYGRYLDIFLSHAPATGIHDRPDLPHQGIHAFRWLLQVFQPAYHFHGHIHRYRPDDRMETSFNNTRVINGFSYREILLDFDHLPAIARPVSGGS